MASASSSDPLYCPSCTEPFNVATNPAGFAPCFHPLCQRCIDKAATSVGKGPRECLWLVHGVYCTTPFTAAQLISGKLPPTHHCNDCNLDLCDDEARAHQAAKMHTVSALGAAAADQIMCSVHVTSPATLYCNKCDQPACTDCLSAAHANHTFIAMAAGLAKRAQQMKDTVNNLLIPKKEQCLATIASVREQVGRLEQHKATTQQQIRDAFDPLIQPLEAVVAALKARKAQLHEQATKAIEADVKALTAQCDEIIVTVDHITRVQETQQQLRAGPVDETKRTALAARIKTLSTVDIPADPVITTTSTFAMTAIPTPTSVLTMDISSLGQIQIAMVCNGRIHPKRDYTTFNQPVRTFGSDGNGKGQFKYPWGLAVDRNGDVIVSEFGNNRFQTVTQQGQHVRFIQASEDVYGIAMTPDNSVWATVGWAKLSLFNLLTGLVDRTINCPGAVGLYRLDDGALIVGCHDKKIVMCINSDGTTRWSSTGQGFRYAAGVATIPDKHLVAVCDYGNNRIQLLSLQDGQFVRSIAGTTEPRSILFDQAAQALLVGESKSISAWTLDGQLIHRWAQGSVRTVGGMAIAPDGTLYASDTNNHRIVAF